MSSAAPAAGNILEGQTRCIFICGAVELHDLWMFADFMASSKIFINTGGIKGTYINTFPINDFLATNQRVAWGYEGPNVGTPLIVHTKTDPTWWQNVTRDDSKHLPRRLLAELENISKIAKYPDKVNIFCFCHGSPDGYLRLGDGWLKMEDLSRIIAKEFNFGVQVNVILASCYSGRLLDLIKDRNNSRRSIHTSASRVEKSFSNARLSTSGHWRGSPFITAYTSSLKLGLKAAQEKTPSRTLQQHIDFVNHSGVSGVGNLIGHPQFHQDGSHNALDAVLNLFLRSYNVRVFEGGEVRRQRNFTPPQPGPQLPPHTESSTPGSASVETNHPYVKGIQHEMDRIRRLTGQSVYEACSGNDKAFFTNIYQMSSPIFVQRHKELFKEVLLGLRWRFQLQESYIFIFDELLRDELISEDALIQPMNVEAYSEEVTRIVGLLEGFDGGAVCGLHASSYSTITGRLGHGFFEMPVRWLAILILRSNPETELQHIISRFVTTEIFGTLHEEFLKISAKPFRVRNMPNANVARNRFDAGSYELGFFLPHGVTGEAFKQWAVLTEMRYTHIRDIFEQMFGRDTWGPTSKFLKLLKIYKSYTLEEYLGPRWRKDGQYVDALSPVSGTSSSGFSATTTASSASSAPPSAGGFSSPTSNKRRN